MPVENSAVDANELNALLIDEKAEELDPSALDIESFGNQPEIHAPKSTFVNMRFFETRKQWRGRRPVQSKLPIQEETHLDTDQIVSPEQHKNIDFFSCPICLRIVNEPKQCSECDTLFCADCIDNWLTHEGRDYCPKKCTDGQL